MLGRLGLPERLRKHADLMPGRHAPEHIREMLEELGPTFVKLGQLLSTRPDIVPEPYVSELTKLQDTAPTVPISEILAVIESEFGMPVEEVYKEFDVSPMAAASLGQVHRATLPDGTRVIVKVQRPGISEQVETDIEILSKRAAFLEEHWDRARTYGVCDVVDEFAMTIREELDYTREARNTDRLREEMSDEKGVNVPEVYWDLTTKMVLTLEEIHGAKITDLAEHPRSRAQGTQLAERLASAFLKQVFVDGFFHADPHPGNILVTPAGEIGLVDCGMVGRLDAENRAGAIRMLMAFEQQDSRVMADEILNLGISLGEVDVRRFTRDLSKVVRGYYDLPSRSVNMGRLLTRVLNVSVEHRIRLPASFAILAKVFTNIDGICSQLDPDFNFTANARGYVGRAMRSELRSETTLNDFFRAIMSTRSFLFSLPEQLERLMRKAVEGTLRVEFKHQGLEDVEATFARSANRIAIALIVAGTIVGSSLVVSAGKGSRGWFGLPTLGLIGYVVALVFGVWLIVSIMKSGKHK
jgi:ubiquinone biosynthesis protein